MEHFYENIEGWFCFQSFYDRAVESAPQDGAHFVEVGAWKGRSASYMAVLIKNSGKNIKFDVVDTWEGSSEHASLDSVVNGTLYDEFLANIDSVKNVINPVRTTSTAAASQYADNSLDFVLIDANHDYEPVKEDILAWLPKVKSGGVMSGDDYPWEGVKRAVDELVPNSDKQCGSDGRYCWTFTKP